MPATHSAESKQEMEKSLIHICNEQVLVFIKADWFPLPNPKNIRCSNVESTEKEKYWLDLQDT